MKIQMLKKLVNKFRRREIWSIGLYKLKTGFDFNFLNNQKPIHLISDASKIYSKSFRSIIADPFLVEFQNIIYVFFEVKTDYTHGKICCCALDPKEPFVLHDYGVVLEEGFHLSFPNVIKFNNEFYMIPEAASSGNVLLYKSNNFPRGWSREKVLIDEPLVDVIYTWNENVFHLIGTDRNNYLRHFISNSFYGPYKDTYRVLTNNLRFNRNGGPLLNINDEIIRVSQCGDKFYGEKLIFNKVKTIGEYSYVEEQMDVDFARKPPRYMNQGHHHLSIITFDGNTWVAVDGFKKGSFFNLVSFIFLKFISFLFRLSKSMFRTIR